MSTPINKGNYSLDTAKREKAFHECLSCGWEKDYEKYRNSWTNLPKEQIISEYPLLVDLELSTLCNLRCPMCYTITDNFKKKVGAGFMDMKLFRKVVDEISSKVPALRLSLRGEATLHPDFIEAIRYAKRAGIREVSTLTNGANMTADLFEEAIDAGIDWITMSVDGLDEVYESIRRPLKFSDTLLRIKDVKAIKDNRGCKKPVIKVQAIWPAIRNDPEKFYNTFAPLTDLVAFNPLIDYLGLDKDIVWDDDFSCPQLYQRLVVGSNGFAIACANDQEGMNIVGDASKQTIYEIWHGKKLQHLRDMHKKKSGFMNIPLCMKCYLPRKTEDSESFSINGRTVVIKNYVNRKQVIGA